MSLDLALEFLANIITLLKEAIDKKDRAEFKKHIGRFLRLLNKKDKSEVEYLIVDFRAFRELRKKALKLKSIIQPQLFDEVETFPDKDIIIAKDIIDMLEAIYTNSQPKEEKRTKPGKTRRGNANETFKIGVHAAKQFYKPKKVDNPFPDKAEIDTTKELFGLTDYTTPERYGIELTATQRRVFEGILKEFSATNYEGDTSQDTTTYINEEIIPEGINQRQAKEKLINKPNSPYKNIIKVPTIRVTQADLIELAGYDVSKQRQIDKDEVVGAIEFFKRTLFYFYYNRVARDKKGNIVIDANGKYKKETVGELSQIFRISDIRDEITKDFKYYEISPAAVLIDQVNEHFLLIPNNWRNEVQQITGKRNAGKYTYEFLFWLRLKYEEIRRYNNKKNTANKPYIVKIAYSELCETLKVPVSVYKESPRRAYKILNDSFNIAIKLGYMQKIEETARKEFLLYLNKDYYPQPGKL
jgi:hypothetical protein